MIRILKKIVWGYCVFSGIFMFFITCSVFVISLGSGNDKQNINKNEIENTDVVICQDYIANRKSGKLHYYTCNSLPSEYNSIYFSSKKDAYRAGYYNEHVECMKGH